VFQWYADGYSPQWMATELNRLRIVPEPLWERVKARQRLRAAEVGEKIRRGLKGAGGHGPRYLFSGLMKCESCGSPVRRLCKWEDLHQPLPREARAAPGSATHEDPERPAFPHVPRHQPHQEVPARTL
jgi:hypothetical protein